MSGNIIKSKDFNTSQWAGGNTTELFIYPINSTYKALDFDFRISSATVQLAKSDFTSLPNVSRKLMILDGEIVIKHRNRYYKKLRKFDMDEFEGDWSTTSEGKCTDFNVMTRNATKSQLRIRSIRRGMKEEITVTNYFTIIYLYKGNVRFKFEDEIFVLKEKELLVCKINENQQLFAEASSDSDLIISDITKD